jgi:hypothetical protein
MALDPMADHAERGDDVPAPNASSRARGWADGLVFLAFVPFVAHRAFSWMGFNPTDDGFVLAYGRRLLDGQVPHRDFISIRPVGSPLLHLPELLLAGDFALHASRFVWWCELALVAWIWVALLAKLLDVELAPRERLALRLLAVMLSAHVAPPRAWHTVDGIALASIGMSLATSTRPWAKVAGYVVVGAAGLCKQNFAVLPPVVLAALGDWRRPRYWLAAVGPGVLYVLVVSALGGWPDLVVQLGAQHDLVVGGVVAYASYPAMLGIAWGALVGWLPRLAGRHRLLAAGPGALAVLLAPIGLFTTAISGSYTHYARVSAFVLFGVALGRASALASSRNVVATRTAVLVLALAWASSVSLGYRTPAYASGILATLILLLDYPAVAVSGSSRRERRWMPLAALTALTAVGFVAARTQVIYREQEAARLERPLGDVFPGGDGIWTNPRTHAFLADLSAAVDLARARGRPYAIVPDFPGYWAAARQANPLPIDWPQSIELRDPVSAGRVTRSLEEGRGRMLVLVQKVRADTIATALVPLTGEAPYPIVRAVRASFTKIGETEFFEIYE